MADWNLIGGLSSLPSEVNLYLVGDEKSIENFMRFISTFRSDGYVAGCIPVVCQGSHINFKKKLPPADDE